MIEELESGSLLKGELPKGCVACARGSKLVLFVTGKCSCGCFYCPLSLEKRGNSLVYADELLVESDDDILLEAKLIDAEGTGITGGDPLLDMDRTLHFLELLLDEFGDEHHFHLYTATLGNPQAVRELASAGLDEIRFHPQPDTWYKLPEHFIETLRAALDTGMDVGVEIPALPDKVDEMHALVNQLAELGVHFVNLNELEFSEGNYDELMSRGYKLRDDTSAAIFGSEEAAKKVMETPANITVHYCSSRFKDGIQLRKRLIRRAQNIAREWDVITEDGTLVKGIVEGDTGEIMEALGKMDIEPELYGEAEGRVEIAPWILEEVHEKLEYPCFIIEVYPTADRLEVERTPI